MLFFYRLSYVYINIYEMQNTVTNDINLFVWRVKLHLRGT